MTPASATQPQNVNVMAGDGQLVVSWDEVGSVMDCTGAKSRLAGMRVPGRMARCAPEL